MTDGKQSPPWTPEASEAGNTVVTTSALRYRISLNLETSDRVSIRIFLAFSNSV